MAERVTGDDILAWLARLPDKYLLVREEIARIYRVQPVTVTRWLRAGILPTVKTPTGRGRFRAGTIKLHLGIPTIDPNYNDDDLLPPS